jgi:ribonuclease Y
MNPNTWIGGGLVAAAVAFALGYVLRARMGRNRLQSAERQAKEVLEQAAREAESLKRTAVLEGREEALRHKQSVERESQQTRSEQLAAERAFQE